MKKSSNPSASFKSSGSGGSSSGATKKPASAPTHDMISRRAYQLWQDAGSPDGRENEFWLAAESQLSRNEA